MQIVFIHPDLGIGGAERLVVDAALALRSKGHRVSFVTGHHDRKHCFEETKDGTFSVTVIAKWLPRHLFGRFHALFAYLRMIMISLYLITLSTLKPSVIFCDQVSACIPFLKWGSSAKIIFYCHFPDKLLTKRETFLKKLYRKPLDWVEEKTTGMADLLLVNSHFTAQIFRESFPSLNHLETHILHPSLNTVAFEQAKKGPLNLDHSTRPQSAEVIFLSINRYERKKNLKLAINAMGILEKNLDEETFKKVHLFMAGGYDQRVLENVGYHKELVKLTDSLNLHNKVSFFRSVTTHQKMALLHASTAVLYTPDREHFGIVPVEAMYMEKPVIAVNSGGPKETVVHQQTGYLCKDTPQDFANAMMSFINYPTLSKEMGTRGHKRVIDSFSFEKFATTLNGITHSISN